MADLLANIGVEAKENHYEGTIVGLPSREQKSKLQDMITQEISLMSDPHPDAGVSTWH